MANYPKIYADFLRKFLKIEHPLRVVFDCSDGTANVVLKELFSSHTGIDAKVVNGKPNGRFPTHGPNPLVGRAFEMLGKEVREWKADVGIVFDSDADRVFFVDDEGNRLTTDVVALLMAKNFKGPTIVDVRSGFILREGLTREKRKFIESRVGHFFIKKLMRKEDIAFGAEVTGHYYFKDFFYADSGILAAIFLLNEVSKLRARGERLSQWTEKLPKIFSSGEVNFKVEDEEGIMKRIEEAFKRRARTSSKLDGIRMEFGTGSKEWWFNVRSSNTENLLRLNLEAKNEAIFKKQFQDLKALIGSR